MNHPARPLSAMSWHLDERRLTLRQFRCANPRRFQRSFQGSFVHDLTLSDFPFVASLADSADPNDRRIWLRVACDHFVAVDPADSEAIERFAEAVVRQIEKADPPTVLEAARKLAPCPRTPARLLAKLQAASPEASDFVL